MTNDEIMTVFRTVQQAISELGRVLEAAVAELRNKDEELRTVHDTNNRLADENARLRQRGYDLGDELAQARRAERDANSKALSAESERDILRKSLEDAQAECKRLREMILNVAVAIEKAGLGEVAGLRPTDGATSGSGGVSPPISGQVSEPPKAEEVPF